MFFKAFFVAIFILMATAWAYPQDNSSLKPRSEKQDLPAQYGFEWEVLDAESVNSFGHTEQRNGDRTTGSYSVLLPNGLRQQVTYRVNGDSGFIVDIKYV